MRPLEDIEIALAVLGLGREGLGTFRVPQHEVGVRARAHEALARIDVEQLRSVGGRDRHEFAGCQAAGVHSAVPDRGHALLHAARAVRNLREIVAPHGLLGGAEGAVVGGRGVQLARLQAAPQRLLVAARAWPEGRAHHVGRGSGEVRIAIHAVVHQQVARQHFPEHALATRGARAIASAASAQLTCTT